MTDTRPRLNRVARATRRGVRTVLSPLGLRGTATEIAWVAAHGVLYPWGVARRDSRRAVASAARAVQQSARAVGWS